MNLKVTLKLIVLVICSGTLVLLFSCKTKQTVATQYIKVDSIVYQESTITKYDTIVTPADSAYIKAYFECDSLGNVLISDLSEEKGKMKVITKFRNNTIEIRVNVDSAAIIRQAEEQYIKNHNISTTVDNTTTTKKRTFIWWIYYALGFASCTVIIIFKNIILSKLKLK